MTHARLIGDALLVERLILIVSIVSIQVSEASKYSVGLMLSGHTHGGQVFPYHVLAYVDQVGTLHPHSNRGCLLPSSDLMSRQCSC